MHSHNAAGLLSNQGSVPEGIEIRYPAGSTTVRLRLGRYVGGNSRKDFFLLLPA